MFRLFERLFKRESEEVESEVEPSHPLDRYFLFGHVEQPSKPTPRQTFDRKDFDLGRYWTDLAKGCQIDGCQRPSALSVMTLIDIEDKIRRPGTRRQILRGDQNALPKYHWYELCDVDYEDHIKGKGTTPFVAGPDYLTRDFEEKSKDRSI